MCVCVHAHIILICVYVQCHYWFAWTIISIIYYHYCLIIALTIITVIFIFSILFVPRPQWSSPSPGALPNWSSLRFLQWRLPSSLLVQKSHHRLKQWTWPWDRGTVRSCFIGVFLAGSLMQVCVDGFCKKCFHWTTNFKPVHWRMMVEQSLNVLPTVTNRMTAEQSLNVLPTAMNRMTAEQSLWTFCQLQWIGWQQNSHCECFANCHKYDDSGTVTVNILPTATNRMTAEWSLWTFCQLPQIWWQWRLWHTV